LIREASLPATDVDGALRVLELNPFSGADLYDCDPAAVVQAASSVAERLFAATIARLARLLTHVDACASANLAPVSPVSEILQ